MNASAAPHQRDKAGIRRNFDGVAGSYDRVAVLQQVIGGRLLERLEPIRLDPALILDLGSGTGRLSVRLSDRYRAARIVQLDLAVNMLIKSRDNNGSDERQHLLCGDAENLPLADNSVDFAFSNLMFQWLSDLDRAFAEIFRTLEPGGLLLFSSFGPDSLRELRNSWAGVDDYVHVNAFTDMHDVGDALVRAGFAEPVLETETFTLVYDDGLALMRELKLLGAGNVNAGRRRSVTGKGRLQAVLAEYGSRYGKDGLPATFEAVYGHAWVPEPKQDRRATPEPGAFPLAFRPRPGNVTG